MDETDQSYLWHESEASRRIEHSSETKIMRVIQIEDGKKLCQYNGGSRRSTAKSKLE